MVSPEAVLAKTKEVKAFGYKDPMTEEEKAKGYSYPKTKLLRMDFGVLNGRQVNPNNPKCFETNGSLFLAQLMQHHIFTAVLDLSDNPDEQITFPYGFIPEITTESGKIIFVEF